MLSGFNHRRRHMVQNVGRRLRGLSPDGNRQFSLSHIDRTFSRSILLRIEVAIQIDLARCTIQVNPDPTRRIVRASLTTRTRLTRLFQNKAFSNAGAKHPLVLINTH